MIIFFLVLLVVSGLPYHVCQSFFRLHLDLKGISCGMTVRWVVQVPHSCQGFGRGVELPRGPRTAKHAWVRAQAIDFRDAGGFGLEGSRVKTRAPRPSGQWREGFRLLLSCWSPRWNTVRRQAATSTPLVFLRAFYASVVLKHT